MRSTQLLTTASEDQPNATHQSLARAAIYEIFGPPQLRPFAIELWDGSCEGPVDRPPLFTLIIHRPGALRRMFMPPSALALAEAYVRGDFDVAGDLSRATGLTDQIRPLLSAPARLARLIMCLRQLPTDDLPDNRWEGGGFYYRGRPHSRRRDRAAIRHHYDLGNDFYALWLDGRMVYSCAYFSTGDESLDAAQEAKLDLICRKLRLRPGERLLDIGCGWGGLIRYAAEQYGVTAVGITLSRAQADLARQRLATAGLTSRCSVEICDYRDLPQSARFDKIASIGMFEHVGRAKLTAYFKAVYQHLRPGGLFLNHGIVLASPQAHGPLAWARAQLWQDDAFIQRYIFPDGELISSGDAISCAEEIGFEPRDMESLREHYPLTLEQWLRRLDERRDEAVALVGERTYRAWRLYLAASAWRFQSGRIGLAQILLARQSSSGQVDLPRTRADLYAEQLVERAVGA